MPTKGHKWRELYDQLRNGIEDGTYPMGTALPGIPTLIATGELSDSTAKRAFEQLRADGLVEARHGAGHFVIRRTALGGDDTAFRARTEARLSRIERHLGLGSPEAP